MLPSRKCDALARSVLKVKKQVKFKFASEALIDEPWVNERLRRARLLLPFTELKEGIGIHTIIDISLKNDIASLSGLKEMLQSGTYRGPSTKELKRSFDAMRNERSMIERDESDLWSDALKALVKSVAENVDDITYIVELVGSMRRKVAASGDIDLLIICSNNSSVASDADKPTLLSYILACIRKRLSGQGLIVGNSIWSVYDDVAASDESIYRTRLKERPLVASSSWTYLGILTMCLRKYIHLHCSGRQDQRT